MISYTLLNYHSKLWNSGLMSIYEYAYKPELDDLTILNDFFTESNYSIKDESALGRPFVIDNLSANDLKQYSKKELLKILHDFSRPDGWSEPKYIKAEIEYIENHMNHFRTDKFYFISTDFFDISSSKIELESLAYVYYYLFFWFQNNEMHVCQMCLD